MSSPTTVPDDDDPDLPFEAVSFNSLTLDGFSAVPLTMVAGFSASLSELDSESELDSDEDGAVSFSTAGFGSSLSDSDSEEDDSDSDEDESCLAFLVGRSSADESESEEGSGELSGFLRFKLFAAMTGVSVAIFFETFFFGFSCSSSASLSEEELLEEALLGKPDEEASLVPFVFDFLVWLFGLGLDDFALLAEELLEESEDSLPLASLALLELELEELELELELDDDEDLLAAL